MQRTRLSNLIDTAGGRLEQFFTNPWRRISLLLISLLIGFFLGAAAATTAGQTAQWDVAAAFFILLFIELVNNFVYSRRWRVQPGAINQRPLLADSLNLLKVGITYSLFLEAFKLGS